MNIEHGISNFPSILDKYKGYIAPRFNVGNKLKPKVALAKH